MLPDRLDQVLDSQLRDYKGYHVSTTPSGLHYTLISAPIQNLEAYEVEIQIHH